MKEADVREARSAAAGDGGRLSALDAAFLFFERPNELLHIGCVAEIDGVLGFDGLLEVLEARLVPLRRFRQRPLRSPLDLAAPRWEDDPGFDLRHHVRHVALPPPGDEEKLRHVVETLFSAPLAPDRPLWEIHLIEGLASGRSALLCKIHHCMSDGISGLKVLELIADPPPGAAESAPAPGPRGPVLVPARESATGADGEAGRNWGEPGADGELDAPAGEGARRDATRGEGDDEGAELAAGRDGGAAASRLIAGLRAVLGAASSAAAVLGRLRDAALAVETMASLAEQAAVDLPFNGPLGHGRRMVWTSLPLDEIMSLRVAADCTVNDAVLAIVSGALRRYLEEEDVCPADLCLRAVVPVSVRGAGEGLSLGNLLTAMFPRLPVDEPDPVERLQRVREEMRDLKNRGQARATGLVLALFAALPAAARAALLRMRPDWPLVGTVCTNIRGPREALHLRGRRIAEIHPIAPLFQSIGLGFAVASYAGRISICATTDPALVPDGDRVLEAIEESLYETRRALWARSEALALAAKLAAGPTVADLMNRDVVTVGPGEPLTRARDLMRESGARLVSVVDDRFRPIRVLTERDLFIGEPGAGVLAGEDDGAGAPAEPAGARAAATGLVLAAPGEDAFEVGRRMVEHDLDALSVVDDAGRLVGFVTGEQVLRWTTDQVAGARRGRRDRPAPS